MFVIVTTIVSKFGSTRAPHTNSEVYFFTFVGLISLFGFIFHCFVVFFSF